MLDKIKIIFIYLKHNLFAMINCHLFLMLIYSSGSVTYVVVDTLTSNTKQNVNTNNYSLLYLN